MRWRVAGVRVGGPTSQYFFGLPTSATIQESKHMTTTSTSHIRVPDAGTPTVPLVFLPANETAVGSVEIDQEDPAIDITAAFRALRVLIKACGSETSRHDKAIVVIKACIELGFTSGKRIIGALAKLDFDKAHAGIVLSQGLKAGLWLRNEEFVYSLPE